MAQGFYKLVFESQVIVQIQKYHFFHDVHHRDEKVDLLVDNPEADPDIDLFKEEN